MPPDSPPRPALVTVVALTALALLAFAGNSLLCRLALRHTAIDAGSFTVIRLLSGALMLAGLMQLRGGIRFRAGRWAAGFALFAYAVTFSYAYVSLNAGVGALLLFGSVNATMIAYGLWRGESLRPAQWAGVMVAFAGLIGLTLPGLTAPPLAGASLMIAAGVAWGAYSLLGRSAQNPLADTAGNFLRTLPFALALGLLAWPWQQIDGAGSAYAVASGAVTSGLGYAVWYKAQPFLRAATAASLQLSVPVIAAAGGILLLDESLSLRLLLSSMAILGGVALVILGRRGAS